MARRRRLRCASPSAFRPDEAPHVRSLFAAALPDAEIVDAREARAGADYVVAGFRDEALFERQRAMKAVFAFGAGVNGVLALPGLPGDVPLIRLEDAGMKGQMVRYVLATVLRIAGRFDVYARQQRERVWRQHDPRPPSSIAVGVLGIGVIGGAIAQALAAQGFRVRGHARTAKSLPRRRVLRRRRGVRRVPRRPRRPRRRRAAHAGDARDPEPPDACEAGRRRAS